MSENAPEGRPNLATSFSPGLEWNDAQVPEGRPMFSRTD
jgi:hypothetical protein